MRKRNMTAAVLAAVLLLGGCGASAENKEAPQPSASAETTQEAEMTGAYEVNKDLKAAKLPEDAEKAFEKALEGLTGESYEPIALLGRQVVSGTNYAILCKGTPSYPDAQSELAVVTIYEDLSGSASILSVEPFDLSAIAGTDHTIDKKEGVTGAFETNTQYEAEALPEDVQNAFSQLEDSASYASVALLGTQVVSGTNYAILCLHTADLESTWDVVTVYEDFDGKASLLSLYELDPGAFTDYSQSASTEAAQ